MTFLGVRSPNPLPKASGLGNLTSGKVAEREFELEGKVEEGQMEQVMELSVASGRFSFCNTAKTRNAPFTPFFCV